MIFIDLDQLESFKEIEFFDQISPNFQSHLLHDRIDDRLKHKLRKVNLTCCDIKHQLLHARKGTIKDYTFNCYGMLDVILVVLFGEVVEDGDCAHGATPEAELVDSLGAFEMEEDVF